MSPPRPQYGPPPEHPRHLRSYVRRLEARFSYLEDKIAHLDGSEGSLSYARIELDALIWALPILCREAGVEQLVFPMHEPDIQGSQDERLARVVATRHKEEIE